MQPPPVVAVIVKALNEERRIGRCLDAVIREAATVQGEAIVVDSLSTDRTVEIALARGVRVVRFDRAEDVGCGAAVQLGCQFTSAPFVYLLDADMELQGGFLRDALAALQADAGLAGVAGRLLDREVRTQSDRRRAALADGQMADADVGELGGGGLYRQAALQTLGYVSHRGLAAYEEAELGLRLRAAGWRLRRLCRVAVLHEGHAEDNWQMMRRLWRNGRAQATGTFLRAAAGRPWWPGALRQQAHAFAAPAVHAAALAVAVWAPGGRGGAAALGVWALVGVAMAVRKRSVRAALWAILFWHYFSAGLVAGIRRPIADPRVPVPGREVTADASLRQPA